MKNLLDKKLYLFVCIIIVLVGFFSVSYIKKEVPATMTTTDTPVVENEEIESVVSAATEPNSPTYKELINKGHELYVKADYTEALSYFKQALAFGESDRIYRSLYSAYLGLKDYKNAEIAIKKAVSINNAIPNNWIEYASFEHLYNKASFEMVSKIYLDALKKTKDNINIITAYVAYLVENKKYEEAITYLEKAMTIDKERANVFQAEIDYLRTR